MRRASTKVFSLSPIGASSKVLSQSLCTCISSSPFSADQQHQSVARTKFKSCYKTTALLLSAGKTHQFPANPCQYFNTQVDFNIPPHHLSSRQRKLKKRSQLEAAFESAKTPEEMIKAFEEMEAHFDERELGLACLKIGLKLDQEGEDPEKILSFANRALNILDTDDNVSLPVAMTLKLLGSVNYGLKRFNDGLGYLNKAKKMLDRLLEEGSCSVDDIRPVLHAVQLELANTKTAMGRREEALENLKKCLEIKELMLENDSREIGNSNRDLAEAYVAVLNFRDALPYCLRALDIHKARLGNNSVEVAHDRRLLGIIYTGMDEHEKALEQNQLSQKVLKNWGLNSDLLRAEIDAANMQIALGRYEASINTLKGVVQQTEKDSENRALVLISMAKALGNQEKFSDSKRCLEIASGILDKKETLKPLEVAEAYMEISMQYEAMNELETAISLLKRALALLEKLPQEQHSEGSVSARIGWLLLLTGKVSQAIPYLESAAETLKESFGPKHFGVGYIYNNLGAAYLELEIPQSAAQMFAVAKDIMDVALGPHHTDSIDACQNLSKAYSSMGSYAVAIEFQQRAIDAWEGHGANAKDELKEARQQLEQLKMKARVAATAMDTASPEVVPPSPQTLVVFKPSPPLTLAVLFNQFIFTGIHKQTSEMEESSIERSSSIISSLGNAVRKCIFSILSVGPIPNHIAFIMDGNRRYAKKHNLMEGTGHRLGFVALMSMLKYCYELGVKYVTIYAFSIDNFRRRPEEVHSLMELMQEKMDVLAKEESIINRYGVRVHFAGDLTLLSEPVRLAAERAMLATANNSKALLSICIAYTSTNEILHSIQLSCEEKWYRLGISNSTAAGYGSSLTKLGANGVVDEDEHSLGVVDIEKHMCMSVAPDPDIMIRTSGETRLSNFLLWQSAHCFLYFPSALWPEIGCWHLVWAILNFQRLHAYLEKKKKQL
ncbi:hypothetical protein Nepgr_027612 [Nepenthes gracilis]|uniref:Uncharacterized protein n=1 Tax=Nepenthes gracilis TaxID=150966 RepID=A0AAD3Y3A2_NEPGR|nr:hypothetical protein Nepgr_027612 [Nepenthes gracilis]